MNRFQYSVYHFINNSTRYFLVFFSCYTALYKIWSISESFTEKIKTSIYCLIILFLGVLEVLGIQILAFIFLKLESKLVRVIIFLRRINEALSEVIKNIKEIDPLLLRELSKEISDLKENLNKKGEYIKDANKKNAINSTKKKDEEEKLK